MAQDEQPVSITTIFGARSQEGLVQIEIGAFGQQWRAGEARRVGYLLLEAASAADSDTLVMTWLTEKLGLTDPIQKAQVLRDFRKLRAERGSVLADTWVVEDEESNGT
jgi:hypothetical protein